MYSSLDVEYRLSKKHAVICGIAIHCLSSFATPKDIGKASIPTIKCIL
jgi:hypothetical protein